MFFEIGSKLNQMIVMQQNDVKLFENNCVTSQGFVCNDNVKLQTSAQFLLVTHEIEDEKLSLTVILLIMFGCLIVLLTIIGLVAFFRLKSKKKEETSLFFVEKKIYIFFLFF